MRLVTRYLAGGAALVVAAGALAACSGSTPDPASTSTTTSAGGTLQVSHALDIAPGSFMSPTFGNFYVQFAVFETLTRIDGATGTPKPAVAESWELAEDARSMTVHLRDDVTFHSGRAVTAEDIKFSLEQMAAPGVSPQGSALAKNIEGITVDGDRDLSIAFSAPMPNIFDLFEIMPVVNPETFEQMRDGSVVDGTGPFRFEDWLPGTKLTLVKYEDYRDAAEVPLDGIEVSIISDSTANRAALESGRVDYVVGLPPLDATNLSKKDGRTLVGTGANVQAVCVDTTAAPFDDPDVRTALHYAIDRDRIREQVYGGSSEVTNLPWMLSTPGLDAAQVTAYEYDPDRARELLSGVGELSLPMTALGTPESLSVLEIVQNNLAEVGLSVDIQALTGPDYEERLASGGFGVPIFQMLNGAAFSPATLVQVRPELRLENNVTKFSSPEYAALVDGLISAVSDAEKETALADYNAYYLEQAFCTPIVLRQTLSVHSDRVAGVAPTAYGFLDLSRAALAE